MRQTTTAWAPRAGSTILALAWLLLAAACDQAGGEAQSSTPDGFTDTAIPMDAGEDISIGPAEDAVAPSDMTAADSSGDAGEPLAIPHALCGMPNYEILPTNEMGVLIDWEEIPFWTQSAEQVDAILALANYTALSPVDYGTRMLRFRYTTQDRGELVEATALLCLPVRDNMPDAPFPISLHNHGTTGTTDACAPTHPDREMTHAQSTTSSPS